MAGLFRGRLYPYTFNRTTVECKGDDYHPHIHAILAFNRTTVECKALSGTIIIIIITIF